MSEVLPTGAQAYDQRKDTVEIPSEGISTTIVETGPVDVIQDRVNVYRMQALFNGDVTSLSTAAANGRAALTISYEREPADIRRLGIQELSAFDLIRDIKCSKYFESLGNSAIAAVQQKWDERGDVDPSWSDLQKSLYGHMAHGQESYIETTYEFRQTFQTTSIRKLRVAASNPNTVQDLPTLTNTIKNLIDELPDGEWLKKPVSVQFAGRKGWTVTLIYQWAPKWSVIYGGTFNGMDSV